jgi:Sulfotransferase family
VTGVPAESPFADRLVVVLGPRGGGTTWLVKLLLAHPRLAGTEAESTMFTALIALWENSLRLDGEGVCAYLDRNELLGQMRVFCDRMFTEGRDHHQPTASWFVESSPDDVDAIPVLADIYPDAWYIHILRDGRDVVRSVLQSPFGSDGAAAAAEYWAWSVAQVELHRWRLPRFREVRYEELAADPLALVEDLFEWMGLPVDDRIKDELRERAGGRAPRATVGGDD